MSTAPVITPAATDRETEEILADPEVRASLEALDDPEDREDLIDHLKAMKRYREGKDKGIPWEEVKASIGPNASKLRRETVSAATLIV